MHFVPVKPVSANRMYDHSSKRKWKSEKYVVFEKNLNSALKEINLHLPKDGGLKLEVVFGISSRFDLDNGLKAFIDILQNFYEFNDNRVFHIDAKKDKVKKGSEYIEFDLTQLEVIFNKLKASKELMINQLFEIHFGYAYDPDNREHRFEFELFKNTGMFSEQLAESLRLL